MPLTQNAQVFLAIFSWVMCNWLLTSVPLFITGLMGVSLSVVLGVTSAKEGFAPLADPLIFLFMGGFLMARAFEVIELDKKISLSILNHRFVRGSLHRTIYAILLITGFISMWVSNTATTAMMLPIVLGIIKSLDIQDHKARNAILLSTAYAATIGGCATPMGSPPNFIVLGMLQELAHIKLNFFTWVMIGFPITFVLLLFICWYTVRHFPNTNVAPIIEEKLTLTMKDWVLIGVFSLAVFLWFAPSFVSIFLGAKHEFTLLVDSRLNPGVVSIFLASLLFVFPLQSKKKILHFQDAMSIDWGSLFLFGTGISLGQILFKVGLAEMAGNYVMNVFNDMPLVVFLGGIIAFTVFFTEFTSNTAAANILLPLMIAYALKVQLNPLVPAMAVGMSCNLAFMLPVGTPPNAIVFGTGLVTLKEMARYGFILNIVSIILLTGVFYFSSFFL